MIGTSKIFIILETGPLSNEKVPAVKGVPDLAAGLLEAYADARRSSKGVLCRLVFYAAALQHIALRRGAYSKHVHLCSSDDEPKILDEPPDLIFQYPEGSDAEDFERLLSAIWMQIAVSVTSTSTKWPCLGALSSFFDQDRSDRRARLNKVFDWGRSLTWLSGLAPPTKVAVLYVPTSIPHF